jgi:hypothetical protein
VGPALLMSDAGHLLCLQAHLFIQQVWESRVKCRLSSHGCSTAVVCCCLLLTILTSQHAVFSARQPCWTLPLLGWVHAYQPRGSLTEPCLCQCQSPLPQSPYLQGSLAEPCSLPCARALCSQHKGLWHDLAHVKVSSQSLVTGLPHLSRDPVGVVSVLRNRFLGDSDEASMELFLEWKI